MTVSLGKVLIIQNLQLWTHLSSLKSKSAGVFEYICWQQKQVVQKSSIKALKKFYPTPVVSTNK